MSGDRNENYRNFVMKLQGHRNEKDRVFATVFMTDLLWEMLVDSFIFHSKIVHKGTSDEQNSSFSTQREKEFTYGDR
jgi:hypothetical protein